MAATDDIALIRRAYELWAAGDLDAFFDLVHPEVEWVPPADALERGPFRGEAEVRQGIAAYLESFERFLPEPREILPGTAKGDYLVWADVHTRGRMSGAEVTISVGHLIHVRDGKLARLEIIPNRREAMAAAGLGPGGGA